MNGFRRPGKVWVFAALLVLGLLFYAQVFFFPFVHDDIVFIVRDPSIRRWDDLARTFLTAVQPQGALTTIYYRPVLEVLNRIQFAVFGMTPGAFHGVNVLGHALNAFLVFLIACRLKAGRAAAFAAAALFLLHPVQSQAVACVSGMSNIAVTFFLLLAFHEYLARRALAAAVCFAAGLFSKETAMVLPLLLLVHEACRRPAGSRRRDIPMIAGALVVLGLFLLWRRSLFPPVPGSVFGTPHELILRVKAIPSMLLDYLRLILWPSDLHYYRSLDILRPALAPALMFLAVASATAAGLMRAAPRIRRAAFFGSGWMGVTLLPVLNIVPLINEYSLVQVAEHFLYLPLAGGCIALAVGGRGLFRGKFRRAVLSGCGGLVLAGGVMTAVQIPQWRSELALFARTVVYEPSLGRARLLLARAYGAAGRTDAALAEYAAALQIMTDHVKKAGSSPAGKGYRSFIKMICLERGQIFMRLGAVDPAAQDFKMVLMTVSGEAGRPELRRYNSQAADGLAFIARMRKDLPGAGRWFRAAVQADPTDAEAQNNLGMFFVESGNRDMARFWFMETLKVAPGFGPAWENLKRIEQRG